MSRRELEEEFSRRQISIDDTYRSQLEELATESLWLTDYETSNKADLEHSAQQLRAQMNKVKRLEEHIERIKHNLEQREHIVDIDVESSLSLCRLTTEPSVSEIGQPCEGFKDDFDTDTQVAYPLSSNPILSSEFDCNISDTLVPGSSLGLTYGSNENAKDRLIHALGTAEPMSTSVIQISEQLTSGLVGRSNPNLVQISCSDSTEPTVDDPTCSQVSLSPSYIDDDATPESRHETMVVEEPSNEILSRRLISFDAKDPPSTFLVTLNNDKSVTKDNVQNVGENKGNSCGSLERIDILTFDTEGRAHLSLGHPGTAQKSFSSTGNLYRCKDDPVSRSSILDTSEAWENTTKLLNKMSRESGFVNFSDTLQRIDELVSQRTPYQKLSANKQSSSFIIQRNTKGAVAFHSASNTQSTKGTKIHDRKFFSEDKQKVTHHSSESVLPSSITTSVASFSPKRSVCSVTSSPSYTSASKERKKLSVTGRSKSDDLVSMKLTGKKINDPTRRLISKSNSDLSLRFYLSARQEEEVQRLHGSASAPVTPRRPRRYRPDMRLCRGSLDVEPELNTELNTCMSEPSSAHMPLSNDSHQHSSLRYVDVRVSKTNILNDLAYNDKIVNVPKSLRFSSPEIHLQMTSSACPRAHTSLTQSVSDWLNISKTRMSLLNQNTLSRTWQVQAPSLRSSGVLSPTGVSTSLHNKVCSQQEQSKRNFHIVQSEGIYSGTNDDTFWDATSAESFIQGTSSDISSNLPTIKDSVMDEKNIYNMSENNHLVNEQNDHLNTDVINRPQLNVSHISAAEECQNISSGQKREEDNEGGTLHWSTEVEINQDSELYRQIDVEKMRTAQREIEEYGELGVRTHNEAYKQEDNDTWNKTDITAVHFPYLSQDITNEERSILNSPIFAVRDLLSEQIDSMSLGIQHTDEDSQLAAIISEIGIQNVNYGVEERTGFSIVDLGDPETEEIIRQEDAMIGNQTVQESFFNVNPQWHFLASSNEMENIDLIPEEIILMETNAALGDDSRLWAQATDSDLKSDNINKQVMIDADVIEDDPMTSQILHGSAPGNARISERINCTNIAPCPLFLNTDSIYEGQVKEIKTEDIWLAMAENTIDDDKSFEVMFPGQSDTVLKNSFDGIRSDFSQIVSQITDEPIYLVGNASTAMKKNHQEDPLSLIKNMIEEHQEDPMKKEDEEDPLSLLENNPDSCLKKTLVNFTDPGPEVIKRKDLIDIIEAVAAASEDTLLGSVNNGVRDRNNSGDVTSGVGGGNQDGHKEKSSENDEHQIPIGLETLVTVDYLSSCVSEQELEEERK